jgi:imidazolonepropionase-like amidohydrolase
LTPYQALRLATANAAEFVGASDRFGTVAVGRRADLVLLAANPLTDIHATRRIAGVMVRGHWLPADLIAATLGRVAAGR